MQYSIEVPERGKPVTIKPGFVMCTKVGYKSEAQAKKHLRECQKKNRRESRIYFCEECKRFHLTSEPRLEIGEKWERRNPWKRMGDMAEEIVGGLRRR